MKKFLYISLLFSLVVVSACRKSDNATLPDGIAYLNQPQITKVEGGDPAILDTDPLSFSSKVSVDLYFKKSEKPDHLDLVVIKNGDASNPRVLQSGISTYPTEVEISGQQLTELFGAEIVSGDQFDIGANLIAGGKTYAAFIDIEGGLGFGPGVLNQPDASPAVRYSAICGFDIDAFIGDGNFVVVEDAWADYAPGQPVTVTKIDDNSFSIESAVPGVFEDLIVDVDPGDNSATAAPQLIADEATLASVYGGGGAYGSLTLSTGGAVSASFVNPCDDEIQLNVQYVLSKYGNQGAYVLKLKKVE